jgi:competence protein ComEA
MREPSSRSTVVAFLIVALAVAVGAALLITSQPEPVEIVVNPPQPTATPEPSSTPGPIRVYVTGAVAEPNITVDLPAGSRVEDAIEAAGGLTDDADPGRINLADLLRDGDQVHVSRVGETVEATPDIILATPSGGVRVNVNTATIDELDSLPEIGPSLAADIIAYREANGPFASLEDLDQVPGIGPVVLDAIADLIEFE